MTDLIDHGVTVFSCRLVLMKRFQAIERIDRSTAPESAAGPSLASIHDRTEWRRDLTLLFIALITAAGQDCEIISGRT